jgi:hypothetical protein
VGQAASSRLPKRPLESVELDYSGGPRVLLSYDAHVRMQRFPDGSLHKVEAGAVQRETWRRTTQGWKPYNPNP